MSKFYDYLEMAGRELYKTEFPEFGDLAERGIEIPDGFEDTSWHNDVMPSWEKETMNGMLIRIWIDYADKSLSEYPNEPQFALELLKDDERGSDNAIEHFSSDNWDEVINKLDEFEAYEPSEVDPRNERHDYTTDLDDPDDFGRPEDDDYDYADADVPWEK